MGSVGSQRGPAGGLSVPPGPEGRPPKVPFWRPGCRLLHWLPHTGRSSDGCPSEPLSSSPPPDGWRGCQGWSGRPSGGGAKGLSSFGLPEEPEEPEEEDEEE